MKLLAWRSWSSLRPARVPTDTLILMFVASVSALYVAPSLQQYTETRSESATSLAKQTAIVARDLFMMRGPDSWVVVFLSGLLCRVASCRFCPKPLYDRLVAPLVTYATRAALLVISVAAGRGNSLSLTSRPLLIWTLGVGDLLLSSSLPERKLLLEAAFSALSLAALCLLASWHELPVGRLLLQRLALFAIAQAPELAKQTAAAVTTSWPPPAAGAAATTVTAAVPPPPPPPPPSPSPSPRRKHVGAPSSSVVDAGDVGGRGVAANSLYAGAAHTTCCGGAGVGGAAGAMPWKGTLGDNLRDPSGNKRAVAAVAAVAVSATIRSAAAVGSADAGGGKAMKDGEEVSCRQSSASSPPAAPPQMSTYGLQLQSNAVQLQPETVQPSAAVCQMLLNPPPYRSPIRRRTTRIKIPFAEPEQLGTGYVERLQELAAQHGVSLAGVYVREGCIELTLDVESIGSGALYEILMCHGPAALTAADELSDDMWDAAAIMQALGLRDVQGQMRADGDIADIAPAESYTLGGTAVTVGDDQPYIRQLKPRILLLAPPATPPQRGDAAAATTVVAAAAVREGSVAGGGSDNSGVSGGHAVLARLVAVLSSTGGGDAACSGSPQLLVRSQGAYLDACLNVRQPPQSSSSQLPQTQGFGETDVDVTAGNAVGPCVEWNIDLFELPNGPGALLFEFRWDNELCHSLPVLALDDASMAAELAAAVEAGFGAAATGRGSNLCDAPPGRTDLDDLLLDLDTWMRHLSPAVTWPHARTGTASTSAGVRCQSSQAPPLSPPLPAAAAASARGGLAVDLKALGMHLLGHATACGWSATADRIRSGLQQLHGNHAAANATATAANATATAAATAAAATDGVAATAAVPMGVPSAVAAVAATIADKICGDPWCCKEAACCQPRTSPPPPPPLSLEASALSSQALVSRLPSPPLSYSPLSLLHRSLELAVRWKRQDSTEEAAFQAYAAPLVFAYGHVIQAVEVMSLMALLFRARHQLLSPGNLTSLAGCAVGTLTTAAWPLLPYRRWVTLVEAAKIPRYIAYMTAKVMIGFLGFPAPPGIVPYQLGPAMLVMEGLLLPGSCLLSPPTALLMALIKWPPSVAMMLGSGATSDPLRATVLAGRVVLLALITTVGTHTYLRYKYARWRAVTAAARRALKQQDGKQQ